MLHERDVPGALAGGADRLSLASAVDLGAAARSPEPASASAVIRASSVPVRVLLRLNDGLTTTGGEFARLVGLGEEYLDLGAEGVEFGFLDADLGLDVATCTSLARALPGVPWTMHRVIDAALDQSRAWWQAARLPGLTSVRAAGSPQGFATGYEELLRLCAADPDASRFMTPAGGLTADQVPWFVQAGVGQFHLDLQARPGGSSKAYVDESLVRSWRLLIDDAMTRFGPGGSR